MKPYYDEDGPEWRCEDCGTTFYIEEQPCTQCGGTVAEQLAIPRPVCLTCKGTGQGKRIALHDRNHLLDDSTGATYCPACGPKR